MKYQKTLNIWDLSKEEIAKLPIGQWVKAGNDDDPNGKGRFLGIRKPGESVVVAWQGNAKGRGRGGYASYQKALRQYAKGA